MGPCNHCPSLDLIWKVVTVEVCACTKAVIDSDISTGDISRASIYYDGAVKQDVARPVTEVNIVKPMNEKAICFLNRVE